MMDEPTPWLEDNSSQQGKSPLTNENPFNGKSQILTTSVSPFGPPFEPDTTAFTSGPTQFISGPSIFTGGPSALTCIQTGFSAGPPAFTTPNFRPGPVDMSSENPAFSANDEVALISALNKNSVSFASNPSAFTANITIRAASEDLAPFGSDENFREPVVNEWNNQPKPITDSSSPNLLAPASQISNSVLTGSDSLNTSPTPTTCIQELCQPALPPPPPPQQQQQQQQQQQFQHLITEGLERVMYAPQPIQTDPFGSIPFRSMTPTPNASPSLSPRKLRADSPFAKSLSPSPCASPSHSPLFDAAAPAVATDNQLQSLDENFATMCLSTNASQLPLAPTAGITAKAIPPPLPPPPPVPPSSAHHHHYQQQHHQYQGQLPQAHGTPRHSPSPPPTSHHIPRPPRSSSHSPINVSPLLSPATIAVYQQQQQQQQQQAQSRQQAVFSFTSSPPSPSSDSSATLASSVNDITAWDRNFATPNPNSLSPAMSPSSSYNTLSTTNSGPAGASSSSLSTSTFATKPRSASVRRYRKRADQDIHEEMRPRTSSMPTKNTCRKPQMLGPPPWQDNDDFFGEPSELEDAEEGGNYGPDNDQSVSGNSSSFYRLRSFATTSKGVVNRGDSLITNCSWVSPNNSVSDYPSPTNSTYSLSSAQILKVFVIGSPGVGKASIIQQLMTSEYMGWSSTDSCEGNGEKSKCVSVLLDNEESTVDFMKLQNMEEFPMGPDIDAYMVVFGIDDRSSFTSAVDLLYRLRKDDVHNTIAVLVANKVDLVRNRAVTTEEAKAVASSYECKYIESSVILNHNLDELLVCMVTQIRHRQRKARSSHERSSQRSRSPVSPKHLFNKLFRRGSISKSYENLSEN